MTIFSRRKIHGPQELKSLDLEANVVTYSAALSTSDAGVNELVVIFHGKYAETVRNSETLKQKMDLHCQKGHLETLDLPIFWASDMIFFQLHSQLH